MGQGWEGVQQADSSTAAFKVSGGVPADLRDGGLMLPHRHSAGVHRDKAEGVYAPQESALAGMPKIRIHNTPG